MIHVENLTKKFGNRTLFDNLSFDVKKGEMVAIVGKSGSGKSTLLNILATLEPYDSGSVIVNQRDLSKVNRKNQTAYFRNTLGFVFQSYALMETETVEDNVKLGIRFQTNPTISVEDAIEMVGMQRNENQIVSTLSGGEQQRVALARVLCKNPQLLLADEPTGNLDEENAELVWNLFQNLKEKGMTVIVVTHDISVLNRFDQVIRL
ncbi:MAG: ABC transporter ATP-binding protein [Erysipelothrix sp.]